MPATSEKQKRFMQAVANNPEFAKQVGVPQSVGKEFTMKKYQDGKAVKKEEKLSPGDAADRAAMRDFGNKSFLQPPKKGPKAGTYTGSMKKSGSKFPDLTGDGKVTQADVLKGRGVGKSKGKKVSLPKGMHRMPDGSVMKDSEHKKMGGGSMKYAGGGKVRGYGMARGGRACKMV